MVKTYEWNVSDKQGRSHEWKRRRLKQMPGQYLRVGRAAEEDPSSEAGKGDAPQSGPLRMLKETYLSASRRNERTIGIESSENTSFSLQTKDWIYEATK